MFIQKKSHNCVESKIFFGHFHALKKKQIKTNVKMSIFCLKHICKTLLSFYYFYNDDSKVILGQTYHGL